MNAYEIKYKKYYCKNEPKCRRYEIEHQVIYIFVLSPLAYQYLQCNERALHLILSVDIVLILIV